MALRGCGAEAFTVRTPAELDGVDALVLPGGESTTMSRLLRYSNLECRSVNAFQPACPRSRPAQPDPHESRGARRPPRPDLAGVLTSGRRNGYGRQVESFEADIPVVPLGVAPFRAVFIRAPLIEDAGRGEVIATFGGNAVAVARDRTSVSASTLR